MLKSLLSRVFGSANDRLIKKMRQTVITINALEPAIQALTDAELQAKTGEFRKRLAEGLTVDDLLPEAFAVVREASRRVLKQRHYDVQLIGGMVLHRGMFAEMKTGEGKTLTVTLPVYLNALTGKGVHVVTVNDYLAQRDATWMGQLYQFLGLTVGCILHGQGDEARRLQYTADVTYGTNSELGFDYLRDNMKFKHSELVQRPFAYAIVDEADSILIDEARTPLIISGPAEDSSELYKIVDQVIPKLTAEDVEKEEKQRLVTLTEQGSVKVEQLLQQIGALQGGNLYDAQNIGLVHHVNQALMAHKMYHRDVDYIVKEGKVIIIDEFTGRMMDGRRYSDGLHQALEAKEGVEIQVENQTLASITYQNYFRLYPKLAGMSGTAATEASELMDIYKLEVVILPTNVPCIRIDHDDEVYRTEAEKFQAILKLLQECQARQQPVLVGTVSIEKSEKLSAFLKKHQIPHQVLNARYHEQEAQIIAEAGRPGAVTIATNMAGRGTDIKLGGNIDEGSEAQAEDVKLVTAKAREAGGLFVIGTERHESRRIDNQLRGRSGRQGDPGASKFFLCLEDDLLRIFGSQRLDAILVRLGMQEGEAITHRMVTRAIEKAQVRVEARNYDIRKQLLKYDNVMNDQRQVIYEQRRALMVSTNMAEEIAEMKEDLIEQIVARYVPEHALPDQWNLEGLHTACLQVFNLDLPIQTWSEEEGISEQDIKQRIYAAVEQIIQGKIDKYGYVVMQDVWQNLMLRILDQAWKEHLLGLDHLRQGINLRAYGQRDPLNEYKHEAFMLFKMLMAKVREGAITSLCHLELELSAGAAYDSDKILEDAPSKNLHFLGGNAADFAPVPSENVARNAPCPCGSGKKFKHCHGKI